jgi:cytidyltransferase-like protein
MATNVMVSAIIVGLKKFSGSLKLLAIFCFLLLPARSLYLEKINLNSLKNTRIAYYPGSFDPLHLGHKTVVQTVLDKGLADYVFIYALPDSDTKKNRTPFVLRFAMLESIYKDHPRVLITKLMPADMQETLSPLFHDIKFSVVIGSDIVNQYVNKSDYDTIWMQGVPINQNNPEHANTSTGAIMAIPAKRVIAFNREGEDLSYVGTIYKCRPLTILTTPANADLSSTVARLAVREGRALDGIVPVEVKKIIQENGLYKQPSE